MPSIYYIFVLFIDLKGGRGCSTLVRVRGEGGHTSRGQEKVGRVIGGQMHEQKHSINSSRRDDSTYRRRYREELFEAPYVVIYVSVICIYHLFLRFLFFIFSLFERGIFSLLHFLRKLRPGRGFFFKFTNRFWEVDFF